VELPSSITRLTLISSASYSYSVVHHALQMIILITLLLKSGNPPRKRLGDGKELMVLEKYMRLWIGRRDQRATICIALTIHRYLVSACCLRLIIKTQNRGRYWKCQSTRFNRSSPRGQLHFTKDTTLQFWCPW